MNKRIISFILMIAAVAVFTFSGGQTNIKAAGTENMSENVATVSGNEDTKTYDTTKLEDEFADDKISIVLDKDASLGFKPYTEKDFPEIKNISVEEATAPTTELVKKQIKSEKSGNFDELNERKLRFNIETYRRILHITLKDKGKENVLKAIKLLEKRNDILCATPSKPGSIAATYPSEYSSFTGDQKWALDKINAPGAWDSSTGSSTVTVAVIDSGIDTNHNDLKNRISSIPGKDYITGTYNGKTQGLIYGGATYYYTKSMQIKSGNIDETYTHTVLDEKFTVESNNKRELVEHSNEMAGKVQATIDARKLYPVTRGSWWEDRSLEDTSIITETDTVNPNGKPFNLYGNCGYVAASLIVWYAKNNLGITGFAPNGYNNQLVYDIQGNRKNGSWGSDV